MSTQIRQLEGRPGEELLLRGGCRLLLTNTGQLVLTYAESIFGLGQEMLGCLRGSTPEVIRLCVGSVVALSRNHQENWICPLLADLFAVLTLKSGLLEGLISRPVQHQPDVVLANESVSSDSEHPLHCQFLGSQFISLVDPANVWQPRSSRIPEDLEDMEVVLPGPCHALRAQPEALCVLAGAAPWLCAEVDNMVILRLVAHDSGWLIVLPEMMVQDELHTGILVKVDYSVGLQEHFCTVTTRYRHRIEVLETLLERSLGRMGPSWRI